MIHATIIGNVGKDAELLNAGQDTVCSFSVASSDGFGDKRTTTWVRCSVWGKRGEKLSTMLTKGTRVAVAGSLTEREYDGKKYLEMRANDVEFTAPKTDGTAPSASSSQQRRPANGGASRPAANHTDDYGDGDFGDAPF